MTSLHKSFVRIQTIPHLARWLSLAGGVVYFFHTLYYAIVQSPILDEGTYLVKGYLFATGQYTPFQLDGPWTNQMPLSFWIPGLAQRLLGPGLRTGRYFSIFIGLLMLVGLWLVARRLGGEWWGSAAVWIIAVSPAYARVYSMAVSQVLAACMLVWILVLVVKEKTSLGRAALAGFLIAILILTRNNMIPVLFFITAYLVWQSGWRVGGLAALAAGATLFIGHALYWPDILTLWIKWLPESLTPFLNAYRIEGVGKVTWDFTFSNLQRFDSFLDSLRFNFFPLVGLLGFFILLCLPKSWSNRFHYHSAILLAGLSATLVVIHAWASLFNDYCLYCLSGYLMFFSPILILLVILTFQSCQLKAARWYSIFVIILTMAVFLGIGYGAAQEIGPTLYNIALPWPGASAKLPVWGLIEALGFGDNLKNTAKLVSFVFGGLVGILVIAVAGWLYTKRKGRSEEQSNNLGFTLMGVVLISGVLLSPTSLLSKLEDKVTCRGNIIQSVEQVGKYLSETIPENSLVYWKGPSAVPLLYIPQSSIFPPQLNDFYSFRQGGDMQALRSAGFWNEELSSIWLEKADFVVIHDTYINRQWRRLLESLGYVRLPPSPLMDPCQNQSRLHIYQRK